MRTVYDAAHGVEAQIVADVLKGEGIEATVTGAGLVGAAGELPAIGLVKVHVADDDVERARAVIRAWEATKLPPDPDEPAPTPPFPRAGGTAAFVAGAVVGALLTYTIAHGWPHAIENKSRAPGEVARRWIEDGGRTVRIETDRNGDGHYDDVIRMGEADGDYRAEVDHDFDGVFEYELWVVDWIPVAESIDYDEDGDAEYHASYRQGRRVSETWSDTAKQRIVKRTEYDGLYATNSDIDTDGDGRLDTRRRYDARGEIDATEPIAR